ncbi:MAG TPA: hypothetical protein VF546_18795 [Pyrinomonadaceae bacterium]
MKHLFRLFGLSLALVCLLGARAAAQTPTPTASPTPDPFVVQITSATPAPVASPSPLGSADVNAYVGDVSGDGRFVVFESKGDLATIPPGAATRTVTNGDGNREIFLWDAAQRRIFQLTNTRSALVDNAASPFVNTNIAVEVSNNRPQISRDGRWIVFSSNAPTPGSFDGTVAANKSLLQADGNQEVFLYRLPDVPAADLTSGMDTGYTNLAAGTFTRVTDTPASAVPRAGTAIAGPFVADDNRFPTINDTGSRIAFVSTRDLTPCSATNNPTRCNPDANPEIFAWRPGGGYTQITVTSGTFVFNDTPSISGGTTDGVAGESNDSTVAFFSNAATMPDAAGTNAAANNSDGNGEVFVATYNGTALTALRQVTRTKVRNAGQIVVALGYGRRVSRNGNLVAFESGATDPVADTVPTLQGGATFVYNISANTFVTVGPRASDDEVNNQGGDTARAPTFTGDNARLVFVSNLNIKPDGTFAPAGDTTGLNPNRETQIWVAPVPASASTTPPVTRLTNLTGTSRVIIQFALSNTPERIAFNLPVAFAGSAAAAGTVQAFYLVAPPGPSTSDTAAPGSALAYQTGASRRDVATPTASPTPTPSPTPLAGLSPGEIGFVRTTSATPAGVTLAPSTKSVGCMPAGSACDAASESHRQPPLPFELNGVSVVIGTTAAGLYFVSPTEIQFEVPRGLTAATASLPVTVNIREAGGVRTVRSLLQIVATQPDIFTTTNGPGGRAAVTNVTNPLLAVGTPEPFTVRTTYTDASGMSVTAQTKLRLLLTGVRGLTTGAITVRLVKVSDNSQTDITGTSVTALMQTDMPGVFQLDFLLPETLAGAGDVAVIVIASGQQSRPADTAPRFTIAPNP